MSPCGYGVDLLRAAYSTKCRFYTDTDQATTIKWYKVPNDREFLPVPNAFVSSIWDSDGFFPALKLWGYLDQGELLEDPHVFWNGQNPGQVIFDGHFCGTPSQWAGDLQLARDGTAAVDVLGNPLCCTRIPFVTVVEDVFSPLDTLTVSPHFGHVLVDINMAHENQWQVIQTFNGSLDVTNGFMHVTNATPTPVNNGVIATLQVADLQGSATLSVDTTPIAGSDNYSINMALIPDLTGGIGTVDIQASSSSGFQDIHITLHDATGASQDGVTGTLSDGTTVYGGIVTMIGSGGGGGIVIGDPVTGSNPLSPLWVDASGNLANDHNGDMQVYVAGGPGIFAGLQAITLGGPTGNLHGCVGIYNRFTHVYSRIYGNAAASGIIIEGQVSMPGAVSFSGGASASFGFTITNNGGLHFTTQTSGPGSGAGTLTNAPSAGNPNFWLPVNINGTVRHIPCW